MVITIVVTEQPDHGLENTMDDELVLAECFWCLWSDTYKRALAGGGRADSHPNKGFAPLTSPVMGEFQLST